VVRTTLPERYDLHSEAFARGLLLEHFVIVTLPDLYVVQSVPACARLGNVTAAAIRAAMKVLTSVPPWFDVSPEIPPWWKISRSGVS
jgi:hypothetical protein